MGIYGDYGNPVGQVIITEAKLAALFPDISPRRFGVRIDPSRVTALSLDLGADFGLT